MDPTKCFVLTPTGIAARWLRRHTSKGGKCPRPHGYHSGMVRIENDVIRNKSDGGIFVRPDVWPHDDPRWPKACECGRPFTEDDDHQLFFQQLYEDPWGRMLHTHLSELPGADRAPAG